MRLAFMGSPEFSLPSLAALLDAGHDMVCVYSQPPRPAGRGKRERKTAVHDFAEARGIEVRTPRSLKRAEAQEAFAALAVDAAIVVAYGLILPPPILAAPRLGCINLHASLLPRWRGAAPIQRALMAGDRVTGIAVMQMTEGLDEGPVFAVAQTPIEPDDTAGALHDRLATLGGPLLVETLAKIEQGAIAPTPQPQTGVTYAHKITPAETRIDWAQAARAVDLQIRGLSPAPGAWFEMPGERGPLRIKALDSRLGLGEGAPGEALDDALLIACGKGAVRLTQVQREGRGAMSAEEFLRGTPTPAGLRLA